MLFSDGCREILTYSTDSPMSEIVRGRVIDESSSSEATFNTVSEWVQTCLKEHPRCAPNVTSVLPTRVIDLGDAATSANPFLKIAHGECGT